MTDYEKAVKDAHSFADKAMMKTENGAKFLRSKFKLWADSEWRTFTKGEALGVAAIIVLLLFVD